MGYKGMWGRKAWLVNWVGGVNVFGVPCEGRHQSTSLGKTTERGENVAWMFHSKHLLIGGEREVVICYQRCRVVQN